MSSDEELHNIHDVDDVAHVDNNVHANSSINAEPNNMYSSSRLGKEKKQALVATSPSGTR